MRTQLAATCMVQQRQSSTTKPHSRALPRTVSLLNLGHLFEAMATFRMTAAVAGAWAEAVMR
jgi:hypothetical protein